MTSDLSAAEPPAIQASCPICEQSACSLLHVRDRLVPVYNAVVVPAVNTGARVLSRVCLMLAVLVLLGAAAGWWS
jgi:hypothetical protein